MTTLQIMLYVAMCAALVMALLAMEEAGLTEGRSRLAAKKRRRAAWVQAALAVALAVAAGVV
jgi:Tfp pilus assembly protein PilX